jgi:transposase
MPRHISVEKKALIAEAISASNPKSDLPHIAELFETTIKTVRKIRDDIRIKGVLGDKWRPRKAGRPPQITAEIEEAIDYFIHHVPTIYQDELATFIFDCFDTKVSQSTISRALKRINITRKKLQVEAAQRNQVLRLNYQLNMSLVRAGQYVFVDESGSDERTGDRSHGYAKRGVPARVARWLRSRTRISVLPAYTVEGYIDFITFEGTCNAAIFEEFILGNVLPLMNRWPQDRSVLVMDNHSIHHARIDSIKEACLLKGVKLVFLPPYSPDYNPIEESFNDLKALIRREYKNRIGQFDSYHSFFQWAVRKSGMGEEGARRAQGHFYNVGIRFDPDE